MSNIEYVNGQESHSSYWGKYYVKGLEDWSVKEDFEQNKSNKHANYQGYVANDIPEGTVFTIFEQNGNKRGTDDFIFTICVTTDAEVYEDKAAYGDGLIQGNYKVICTSGNSKVKASRLMDWWISNKASIDFAEHCAKHIDKRGLKSLPPMS